MVDIKSESIDRLFETILKLDNVDECYKFFEGVDLMALDYTIIGQRLRKARLDKRMTQENLAEKIDVSVAFLSRIERGLSHINLKRLSQICAILDVTEGFILNGTSSTSDQYLISEFNDILTKCPARKQKLIYKIAKTIAED